MVKVLPNGDIVPDDDPRASGRSNVSNDGERNRPRQVHIIVQTKLELELDKSLRTSDR